jgi:hypothetical protein
MSAYLQNFLIIFAFSGVAGCVNISGLQNPSVPKELGNDRYIVGVGLQSNSDLTQAMFMFCDQQKRIYQEISNSGIQLTFACLSEEDKPLSKTYKKRNTVKTLY